MKRIIDRYLTIPGWKLEGFTAVNPKTDTPKLRGIPFEPRYPEPGRVPARDCVAAVSGLLPGPVIAKDYEEAMQYGEVSHHYELSIEGNTATVTFDKYYTFKLTKL